MERIKQLLFLLVFLLGSGTLAQAQLKVPSVPDLDKINGVAITVSNDPLTVVYDGSNTAANLRPVITVTGNTGTYDNGDDNGLAQRVEWDYDIIYTSGDNVLNLSGASDRSASTDMYGGNPFQLDFAPNFSITPTGGIGTGTYTIRAYVKDDLTVRAEKTFTINSVSPFNLTAGNWTLPMGVQRLVPQANAYTVSVADLSTSAPSYVYASVSGLRLKVLRTSGTDVVSGTTTMYFDVPATPSAVGGSATNTIPCADFASYIANTLGTGNYTMQLVGPADASASAVIPFTITSSYVFTVAHTALTLPVGVAHPAMTNAYTITGPATGCGGSSINTITARVTYKTGDDVLGLSSAKNTPGLSGTTGGTNYNYACGDFTAPTTTGTGTYTSQLFIGSVPVSAPVDFNATAEYQYTLAGSPSMDMTMTYLVANSFSVPSSYPIDGSGPAQNCAAANNQFNVKVYRTESNTGDDVFELGTSGSFNVYYSTVPKGTTGLSGAEKEIIRQRLTRAGTGTYTAVLVNASGVQVSAPVTFTVNAAYPITINTTNHTLQLPVYHNATQQKTVNYTSQFASTQSGLQVVFTKTSGASVISSLSYTGISIDNGTGDNTQLSLLPAVVGTGVYTMQVTNTAGTEFYSTPTTVTITSNAVHLVPANFVVNAPTIAGIDGSNRLCLPTNGTGVAVSSTLSSTYPAMFNANTPTTVPTNGVYYVIERTSGNTGVIPAADAAVTFNTSSYGYNTYTGGGLQVGKSSTTDALNQTIVNEGKATYSIIPVVESTNAISPNGMGTGIKTFTIDARKTLATSMFSAVNGETYYEVIGAEYGPVALTNSTLSKNGNPVMDIKVTKQGESNPIHQWNAQPAVDGVISMPSFILTGITQQTVYVVSYTLRYSDNFGCPTSGVTGEYYLVVKPYDLAVNQDLMASPVSVSPICYAGLATDKFSVQFGATYNEIDIYSPEANLPVDATVSYRVVHVSGDQVVDLSAGKNVIPATADGLWEPLATRAGKGIYMVTPQFNDVVTNTNGVPVYFTLYSCGALDATMVALSGQTLTYQNGDLVPEIKLDGNLPEGAVVTWTRSGSDATGVAVSGANVIPAFNATNTGNTSLSSTINYTIAYADGQGCSSVDGSFSVVIAPNTVEDLDLVMGTVDGALICGTGAFGAMGFTATQNGLPVTATYRIEFVSGDNIITLPTANQASTWNPSATKTGKGLYRVTPIYNNNSGVSRFFTLEARTALLNTMVGLQGKTLTYNNGELVPEIKLDANLPEGAVVTWTTANGSDVGMSVTGGGNVIPAFTAENEGTTDTTATINYTIAYADGQGCGNVTGTFTIAVAPYTVEDLDLVAGPVANQVICRTGTFAAAGLTATYKGDAVTTDARYRVEFVDGTNIITLPATVVESTWAPTVTGTGNATYRVTPIYNNKSGVSTLFTLEARAALVNTMVALQGQTLTFKNGDMVPEIELDGNLPEGAVVTWTRGGSDATGVAASGANVIPAFNAINTGATDLSSTINYTIAYADGLGCGNTTGSFMITVIPYTVEAFDLVAGPVANQVICTTGSFAAPSFTAAYKGNDVSAAAKYRIEFVDGVSVITLPAGTVDNTYTFVKSTSNGVGTYRVTPIFDNNQGVSRIFTLESRSALAANMLGLSGQTLTYNNGDAVPEIKLDGNLPEGVIVTWTRGGSDATGVAVSGKNVIPAFNATNTGTTSLTTTISYTIAYADGQGCSNTTGTFTIAVAPKSIEDLDLSVAPVTDQDICFDSSFTAIPFTATQPYATPFPGATNQVTFEVEFVNGAQVLDLTTHTFSATAGSASYSFAPVKKASVVGTGTYRVTPHWGNNVGTSVLFNMTVRAKLDINDINLAGKTVTYENGDPIADIVLNGNLPAGTVVTWTNSGDNIGSTMSGKGLIPAFRAINTTSDDLTAVYDLTLAYADGQCTAVTGTFSIVVKPNTINDYDLVMTPVVTEQRVCNDANVGFEAIEFLAKRTDNLVFTGDVKYVVSYVGGTEILDLTEPTNEVTEVAETAAEWTPKQLKDKFGNPIAGTGVYRVTPYWNNNQGLPVLFTLTTYPLLDNTMIDIQDMVFFNGQEVSEYTFEGTKLPEGITIAWEIKPAQPKVGTVESGVSRIPAFTAVNTTGAPVTAEYIAWLKYEECSTKADAITFTITVNPREIQDNDLHVVHIADQTICNGGSFADVELKAIHNFNTVTAPLMFAYELVGGVDVLGYGYETEGRVNATSNPFNWAISNSTSTVVGSGTYKITPIWNNFTGVSTTFTLTRLSAPQVDVVDNMVLCSGDVLDVVFTSKHQNDNQYTWTATANSVGIPTSGSQFINTTVVNKGTTPEVVTITVVPHNPGYECPGTEMTFEVTVNPVPVANYVSNFAFHHGEVVQNKIQFTGTATSYEWSSSNPAIYENVNASVHGTVVADASGAAYLPEFQAANYTADEFAVSRVTVTPYYGNCAGDPIEFNILVGSEMFLDHVYDKYLCEGEIVPEYTFTGLPASSRYYITWAVKDGVDFGLADSNPAVRVRTMPKFTAKVVNPGEITTATVVVTPWIYYNGFSYSGKSIEVNYIVSPKVVLENGYEASVTSVLEFCHEETVTLDVQNVGDESLLTYQWYKNHIAIAGATDKTYVIDAATVADAADYYCEVTGPCDMKRSLTYRIVVKVNVVSQRWSDVLTVDCNPSTNGGYEFSTFQWYNENGKVHGETKSWIQVTDKQQYHVVAMSQNGEYVSCPISIVDVVANSVEIAPNPVKAGGSITVTLKGFTGAKVHVINNSGAVQSTTQISGSSANIQMPNVSGIYIVRVIPDDASIDAVQSKVIVN